MPAFRRHSAPVEASRGAARLVVRELPADLLTPVAAFLALAGPKDDAFLLESAAGGEVVGRYSYLGARPRGLLVGEDGLLKSLAPGERADRATALPGSPLEALRGVLERRRAPRPEGLPPLTGGLIGYFGWRTSGWVESLPSRLGADLDFPDALLGEFDDLVAFDNLRGRALAISAVRVDEHRSAGAALDHARARCDEMAERLGSAGPFAAGARKSAHPRPARARALGGGRATFLRSVRRALEYIRAGDIFQTVVSQRFEIDDAPDGFAIYRALRGLNPSPYLFYLRLAGRELIGGSPEALASVRGRELTLRPIAGTRRRGATPAEDARLAKELAGDPKERAEHVMLVDLARNDCGRVSAIGSVRVEELMALERYSHVMHLVSRVRGTLREGADLVDAIAACFPAGTLSGAPKIRAMEIIDELEPVARGPYGGGAGYLSDAGDLDLAITIRTLMKHGPRLFAQAGAGIVADSNPEAEWREVQAKAAAVLRAVELAR